MAGPLLAFLVVNLVRQHVRNDQRERNGYDLDRGKLDPLNVSRLASTAAPKQHGLNVHRDRQVNNGIQILVRVGFGKIDSQPPAPPLPHGGLRQSDSQHLAPDGQVRGADMVHGHAMAHDIAPRGTLGDPACVA